MAYNKSLRNKEERNSGGIVSRVTHSEATCKSACVALLFSALSLLSLAGCTTTATYLDQKAVRSEALSYYNNEIMENLVRASQGMLFVHVDLTNLQATVTTNYSATLNGGQSLLDTGTNGTTIVGKMVTGAVTAATAATRPLSFSLNPNRSNVILMAAAPTFGSSTQVDVYSAYVRFLNARPGDTNLDRIKNYSTVDFEHIVTIQRIDNRSQLPAHVPDTEIPWRGKWYYVPWEFRPLYFQLCLEIMARPHDKTSDEATKAVKRNGQGINDLQGGRFIQGFQH
jgi:hypothetical protein